MNKPMTLLLALVMLFTAFTGACAAEAAPARQTTLLKSSANEDITLVVAGPWADCRALELVAARFSALYPNCEVKYEYLQDYDNLVIKRLGGDEYAVDLFMSNNILRTSPFVDYALDLYSRPDAFDFSQTFDGLRRNFSFIDEATDKEVIYALPLGAEIRGLYVNKTLLNSLGLDVPANRAELLDACEKLKNAGYIAFQGNPGHFAQLLLYPYICNLIANAPDYAAAYARVAACEPGVSDMFRAPLELLYELVERGYYNYKFVETETRAFTDSSDVGSSMSFLSIRKDENGEYKAHDVGDCAFWPSTLSIKSVLDGVKEDYHSPIEYEFMLAPMGDEGGFAYMSPARGIAVNKRSSKLEWALKFMDFLFTPEYNVLFAEAFNITPNVKDAFKLINDQYGTSAERISELGQVSFDYAFYNIINESLVEISKANNPKYMAQDESGNAVMVSFEEFMARLEARFEAVRASAPAQG